MFSPRESNRNPLVESKKKRNDQTDQSEKDFVSDIGRNLKKEARKRPEIKKKRTLHIYDFKKFKFMREEEIKKRYTFGR